MKKYIIITILIIVAVIIGGLYLISQKAYYKSPGTGNQYYCDYEGYTGYPVNQIRFSQIRFSVERQKDDQIHMIIDIASKPPQTDIVVSRTQISPNNLEYIGNGIDIKDSTSSVQVNLNGKTLQNCHRIFPGI